MPVSAPNVNTVTLVGQLAADPVLRSMPDGKSVCELRLALWAGSPTGAGRPRTAARSQSTR
jgi:single-stranded DNA-binding protein